VRARQIAGGHQKLIDDLPTGKDKRTFGDLHTITTRKDSFFQQN
jgi:hypothetical protein